MYFLITEHFLHIHDQTIIETLAITTYTGNALPEEISSLAADRMLVYAAYGKLISAFAKSKEVKHESSYLVIYCALKGEVCKIVFYINIFLNPVYCSLTTISLPFMGLSPQKCKH